MSVTSLQFSSVQDLQHAKVDTDKLLKEGSLKVGSHRYSVSLANDGTIAVKRDHNNASQIKRFFSATKELVSHRMKDDSGSSRSDRIADSLNGHKMRNDREKAVQQRTRFQASARFTETGRPAPSMKTASPSANTPSHKQAPTSKPQQLTLDDFVKAEQSRADYHGEEPNENLAKEEFNKYRQSQPKPSTPQQTPQTTAANNRIPTASTEAKRTLDDFVRDEKGRADYHGEAPNLALAKAKYQEHIQSQSPQPGSSRIKTSVSSNHIRPEPLIPRQEINNAKERQAEADYYGYQSGLSSWEKKMLEAESQPPRQTANSHTLGRTGAAPTASKEERLTNRLHNLKSAIDNLPPNEKRIAEKTLKTFENTAKQGVLSLDTQREFLIAIKEQVKHVESDPTSAFATMRALRDELRDFRQ